MQISDVQLNNKKCVKAYLIVWDKPQKKKVIIIAGVIIILKTFKS